MKEKILHVVSSACYRGTLKQAFYGMGIEDEVIYLPVDFSCNYIPKDFSDAELMLAVMSIGTDLLTLHDIEKILSELKTFVTTDYSSYDKVYVWHGGSANDLLLLYLMSILTDDNLYHIDITSCAEFMKKQNSWPYVDMGCVCPDDIKTFSMLSLAKKVMGTEKTEYIGQWNRWKASTKPYRFSSAETGIIEEYPADFMDDTIIKYAKEGRVLGALMAKVFQEYYNLFISDHIILKRIRELYWEHVLDFTVSIREK